MVMVQTMMETLALMMQAQDVDAGHAVDIDDIDDIDHNRGSGLVVVDDSV